MHKDIITLVVDKYVCIFSRNLNLICQKYEIFFRSVSISELILAENTLINQVYLFTCDSDVVDGVADGVGAGHVGRGGRPLDLAVDGEGVGVGADRVLHAAEALLLTDTHRVSAMKKL